MKETKKLGDFFEVIKLLDLIKLLYIYIYMSLNL